MPVAITFAILSMSVSPVTMDPAASVWRVRDFASMPRTCAVLQAAYTAAIGRHAPAFPRDVRPSDHSLAPVTDLVRDARAGLTLSAGDVADLATRHKFYRADSFRPVCAWHGRAGPKTDDDGHAIVETFTSPVFSTNGRLALVEVSFRETGTFGYGLLCTARLSRRTWKARCIRSWIN